MVSLDKWLLTSVITSKMQCGTHVELVSYKNVILHYCCCDSCNGFTTTLASSARSSLICEYNMKQTHFSIRNEIPKLYILLFREHYFLYGKQIRHTINEEFWVLSLHIWWRMQSSFIILSRYSYLCPVSQLLMYVGNPPIPNGIGFYFAAVF